MFYNELNKIDINKMSFVEAVVYSYLTGTSFTSTGYSRETKCGLQYYVYKNKLWAQAANYKAEPIDSCYSKRMKDTYEVYKGDFKPNYRMKMLMVKKQHPEYEFRFVFTNSNAKISKVSQTTYGRWCEKNGFKYADKLIPQEWLEEIKGELK